MAIGISAEMPRIGRVTLSAVEPKVRDHDAFRDACRSLRGVCRWQRNHLYAVRDSSSPDSHIATSDERVGNIDGEPVLRLVVTVRPKGCHWGSKGGGCVMCGHHYGADGRSADPEQLLAQFERLFDERGGRQHPIICVYNGGSVLNPEEFPKRTLSGLCEFIAQKPWVQRLVLETRPEFMDPLYVSLLSGLLRSDQKLVLATGVETVNDYVRQACINKGFTLAELRRHVDRFPPKTCRYYVFMGAPFLTENEVIFDAYRSLTELSGFHPEELHLEPATIQNGTPLAMMWRNGIYKLPSLWSIVFLLRSLPRDARPYVSPFNHFPMPEYMPTSCPACHDAVCAALAQYNLNNDPKSFDKLDCQCLDSWRANLSMIDSRPLECRVQEGIDSLPVTRRHFPEFELETWWSRCATSCRINIGSSGTAPLRLAEVATTEKEFVESVLATVAEDGEPAGEERLRSTICALYEGASTSDCIVTVGATEALYLAFQALKPPATVAVFSPSYQPLMAIPETMGHTVVQIPLIEGLNTWEVDLPSFEACVESQPDMIVVNSPNNPTGKILPTEVLSTCYDLSSRHGTWILSDESFAWMLPTTAQESSFGRAERVVIVNTLSKTLGLPGVRIGWLLARGEFLQRALRSKMYLTLTTSTIDQTIASMALRNRAELVAKQMCNVQQNLKTLQDMETEMNKLLHICLPEGGACCFPRVLADIDVDKFAMRLAQQKGVFVVPGSAFGYPQHFRLGLGGVPGEFTEGLHAIIDELLSPDSSLSGMRPETQ